MSEFASDNEYSVFNGSTSYAPIVDQSEKPPRDTQLPNRYRKKQTEDVVSNEEREALREERRQKARETRRTRRTMRQKQKEETAVEAIELEEPERSEKPPMSPRRIEANTDSDESTIDENFDVASLPESIDEALSWRGRMQAVLHNHWLHVVIVILVALDALIVIFELLLDIGAFNNRPCLAGEGPLDQAQSCHYTMPMTCAPHASMIIDRINISASPGVGKEDLCRCGFRSGLYICLHDGEGGGVNPAVVLHVFSLIILTLFMFEVALKIIAFRLKYFTHKFEVFDGIIVCVSWTLDIASIVQEEAFEVAALVIILRLWRVIRIVNGAVLTSKTQGDNQLHKARLEARKVVHALHKAQDKMDEFEEMNVKLKAQLSSCQEGNRKYKKLRTSSQESEEETTA